MLCIVCVCACIEYKKATVIMFTTDKDRDLSFNLLSKSIKAFSSLHNHRFYGVKQVAIYRKKRVFKLNLMVEDVECLLAVIITSELNKALFYVINYMYVTISDILVADQNH